MKKSYKFGEILLYLREEYKEHCYLLNELNRCIEVMNDKKYYFKPYHLDGSKIKLVVEKEYSKLLKKIKYLQYDWYSQFLYTAYLEVMKNETNHYSFIEDSTVIPIAEDKRFRCPVSILNQDKFDSLIDKVFSLDIMQIQNGDFFVNYDLIHLDFDAAFISSTLGSKSFLSWEGTNDTIHYSIKRDCSSYLLERMLYLEIPFERVPIEWLQIFQKHENKFSDEIFFHVDWHVSRRNNGFLQIHTSDYRSFELIRK